MSTSAIFALLGESLQTTQTELERIRTEAAARISDLNSAHRVRLWAPAVLGAIGGMLLIGRPFLTGRVVPRRFI
jgi:hypothetical protein